MRAEKARMSFIHYIPILTSAFSIYFFIVLYRHWRTDPRAMHIFWWMLGVFFYGAGTVTESINTLAGFSIANFKAWYILGALLGGAPLAQGTVYLLLKRKTADILATILVSVIIISALLVILSPVNNELMANQRLTGKLLAWKFIRYATPFINFYAFIFLVGGAIYSAIKYSGNNLYRNRFIGNVLIAIGGLLPGVGGSFTKFGYVEVLYVTELFGIICIYAGYRVIRDDSSRSLYVNQRVIVS